MVYEHRTYKIPEGKMSDILNRFEKFTLKIFEKYGIDIIGFWTREDANELVYLCKFESKEAMEKAWKAFRSDPEWVETRKRTEANGAIVDEVLSYNLIPTSFSPMQ